MEDPDCEAWLRAATQQISALQQHSSEQRRQSKSLRRFSRAFVKEPRRSRTQELPPSVADFIGEELPQITPSEPKLDVETLATAVLEALLEAADGAPTVMCRLAAALEPRLDLLATLLLSQWLAPALLKPSTALGAGEKGSTVQCL